MDMQRDLMILIDREGGMTQKALASKYDLSRNRIQQIIKQQTYLDAGFSVELSRQMSDYRWVDV